jgi:ABC-type phosphate transport system substrate-binding protein
MLVTALAVCALAALDAGDASALGEQCSGANVTGKGTFLQTSAQSIWAGTSKEGFNGSAESPACSGKQGSGGTPKISYVPLGSGDGLHAWGADDGVFHDKTAKFVATTEPPAGPVEEEGTELSRITSAIGSDVAVVPVTQTAIAIAAHPPMLPAHASCTVSQIGNADLEAVFSGQLTNWRLLEAASDHEPGGDCDQAITRVVRSEDSGTTYQFKHYLDQIEGEALECTGKSPRTWAQLQSGSGEANPNTVWPRKDDCQEGEGPMTVVATNGEGASGPLGFVAENAGTITYADLPEAEAIAPTWIVNVDNGAEVASPSTKGKDANCGAAKYELPSGWESGVDVDWSGVYGSDPSIGEVKASAYPICTLTWDVAATNSFHVFGKKVATTVRNYLEYVRATETGESGRHGHWYLGLPGGISEVASVAIAQIGAEEGEEGEEEEGEGGFAVLCKSAPSKSEGVLTCPKGQGYSGEVTGILQSETQAKFVSTSGPSGTITCNEASLVGKFMADGNSAPEGGISVLKFRTGEGSCGTTLAKEVEANMSFYNPPYDTSKFLYLTSIAPQAAFVLAKSKGIEPQLWLFTEAFKCFYRPTFLSGQVSNGSPTELLLTGIWELETKEESCPTSLSQTATLNLRQGKSESPLYVASE